MVAIVILNYNGREYLEKFLPSVVNYSQGHQIVVADNASTDNSRAFLKTHYPSIKLIELAENKGFAGGYNAALATLEADYYLLLNSDVEVTRHWANHLLAYLQAHPQVGACMPKIRSYHQPTHFEYAGAAGGFIDRLGYPFCRGRIFDTLEADLGQYDTSGPVFWATGACLMIRAELYRKLNGFDDLFFAHMEEIDLCWRLQRLGHEVHYVADSTVYHVGGGTLHKSNPRKSFLNYRNGLAMMYKNLEGFDAFRKIFTRLCLDGVAGVRAFLQGNWQETWAIGKAHFAFYAMIPSLRSSEGHQKPHGVYPRSIVWDYFVRKLEKFSELPGMK